MAFVGHGFVAQNEAGMESVFVFLAENGFVKLPELGKLSELEHLE